MQLEPIEKLTRDLKTASYTLSQDEARFLVDCYYQMQDNRIRAAGQCRSIEQAEKPEPHEVLKWYETQARNLENQVKRALDAYSASQPLGQWARSNMGVGPVIAAGLLAHISFIVKGKRIMTPSAIWAFAGLDPTAKWEKGQKRPWNAKLKSLVCYKLGESFVKTSGNEGSFYGKLYKERKENEITKNESGKNAEYAAKMLEEKNYNKNTDAYKAYIQGILPPAHVHRRAVRLTVQIFLSHYHQVGYYLTFKEMPPQPYVFTHLGHVDKIEPPQWEEIISQ